MTESQQDAALMEARQCPKCRELKAQLDQVQADAERKRQEIELRERVMTVWPEILEMIWALSNRQSPVGSQCRGLLKKLESK